MPDMIVRVLDSVASDPIENAYVKLYSSIMVHQSTQITAATGEVEFIGLALGTYYLRCAPGILGATVGLPSTFEVNIGVGESPVVEITVYSPVQPASDDARYSRLSGYFTEISGEPPEGMKFYFVKKDSPVALASNDEIIGLSNKSVEVVLDSDGYAQLDLPRDMLVHVWFPGLQDTAWEVRTPETIGANLPAVIFPVPGHLKFYTDAEHTSLTETVTVATGATIELYPKLYTYGWAVMDDISGCVATDTDDHAVATGLMDGTVFTITGIAPGTTNVTAENFMPTDYALLTPEQSAHVNTVNATLEITVT